MVKHKIPVYQGIFFITFTCNRWLNLFQIANAYSAVYQWFDCLKALGHHLLGYVIMPNHVHVLIAFSNTEGKSINTIVGNGKRFIAYSIVRQLEALNEPSLLVDLASDVSERERKRNKLHHIFRPSFDWKHCISKGFIMQKLNYIHLNPCRGKWMLAKEYWEYEHSSAYFYVTGKQGVYPVTRVGESISCGV